MNVEFRRATKKDIKSIYNVEVRCFKSPWSLDSIKKDICINPNAIYVVAVDGKRIIGFCAMHTVLDEGHIMNVAVIDEYRGRRVGENLLTEMFKLSSKNTCCYTLEVRESNVPAIRLYSRLGFKSYGLRPGYYADTGESAMIMWREK